MNSAMGRPVADLDDFLEPAAELRLRPVPAPPPAPSRRQARRLWWVLIGALVVASAGGAYWFWRASGESVEDRSTGPAAAAAAGAVPAGVGGFAEMYVAAFLTGSADDLARFLPASPEMDEMTPAMRYVTRANTLEAAPVGPDYWSVLVAADVLTLAADGYEASGLQHYRVAVVDDGGRYVAAALPARVAGPAPRQAAPRSLQEPGGATTDQEAALVGDFLEALLTGQRDLGRYVAPEALITPIVPAPYTGFSITSLGRYGTGAVLATVVAQEPAGAAATLQYVLRIVDHSSGPVVADLLPGPPPITGSESWVP